MQRKIMSFQLNYSFVSLLLIYLLNDISAQQTLNLTDAIKIDYGTIEQHSINSQANSVEFLWKVNDFWELVNSEQEIVLSTRFYATEPGYRLQLMLIPNTTYSDNQAYLGTFFRIVTGIYDTEVDWPFKMKTVLTIVNHSNKHNESADSSDYMRTSDGQPFTVVPNTDPCRLRSAFLRPSADQDFNPNPDGCGNRRHIALNVLESNHENYFINNSLWIKISVHLSDYGLGHRVANISMKFNEIVSHFEWNIEDYIHIQNQSLSEQRIDVLTSEPFYTHNKGYLMQLFLTLLPKRKAFAISLAMAQGDYDRYLQWPFPYQFEVAIVDQSPGYWKRDYAVKMDPSTSECGTDPFFQPSSYPDFCFITVQSIELLTLTHYNFIVNNTLRISFTTKFNSYSQRRQSSLLLVDNRLVSEYNWLIPAVSGKLDKYDLVQDRPKLLASEQFYTNGQGYLCQLLLSVNRSTNNDIELSLEMALIEGQYDSVMDWPFNKSFQLSIVKQNYINLFENKTELKDNKQYDYVINPWNSGCDRHSFQRPIERNSPCGPTNRISFTRISRSQEYLKFGNLLVRFRVYL